MLIYIWWALVFLIGTVIGSGLNVLIFRLSAHKSALWPASHCFTCFTAIKWYDNLPIFGYLILGGRCRRCRAPYSPRYLLIELLTGLLFATLFYIEILSGVLPLPTFAAIEILIWIGGIPLQAWLLVLFHGIWICMAVIAFGCARQTGTIPVSLGVTGFVGALLLGVIYPWPWPTELLDLTTWLRTPDHPPLFGLQIWPVWYPTPAALMAGGELLGLVNALTGAGMGILLLRVIQRPAGEVAYAMSVGALFGWQVMSVIFLTTLILRVRWREIALALPIATILVLLSWGWIGPMIVRGG